MIVKFIEYNERKKKKVKVGDKRVTDDPKEYVAHDKDAFIEQPEDMKEISQSKLVGKSPLLSDQTNY